MKKFEKRCFATDLRIIRKSQGLTQKEMAYKLQIPFRTYQNWELGSRIPPDYTQAVVIMLANEN